MCSGCRIVESQPRIVPVIFEPPFRGDWMMKSQLLLAQATEGNALWWLGIIGAIVLVLVLFVGMIVSRYRRCPSNRILVVYGRIAGQKAAKCLHGGGTFVWPLIQDYAYLNLDPIVIDIPLEGALSLNNIRVNAPSTFTVGVSTDPVLM